MIDIQFGARTKINPELYGSSLEVETFYRLHVDLLHNRAHTGVILLKRVQ